MGQLVIILRVAWHDLRLRVRDVRSTVVLVLLPLVLTGVLGVALGPAFSGGAPRVDVGWVDEGTAEGEGSLLGELLAQAVHDGELSDAVTLHQLSTRQAARQEVGAGRLAAAIIVPEGFARAVESGRPMRVDVFVDPARGLGAHLVTSAVQRQVTRLARGQVAAAVAVRAVAAHGGALTLLDPTVLRRVEGAVRAASAVEGPRVVPEWRGRFTGNQLNALDYYAAAMATIYLLFTAMGAARNIAVERVTGAFARLLVAPVSRLSLAMGKGLSMFVQATGLFTLLIVGSHVLFGVHWGQSPGALAIMVLGACAAASGIGLLMAALLPSPASVEATGAALILIMALLGGAMFPLYGMPEWMKLVSRLTFNGWALDGLLRLTFEGGTLQEVAGPITALLTMAAVTVLAGAWSFARR